ncbi:hypothetical protein [uncultured Williamsia sp.]|uniref:hypothetical protein n=1 Tax=uncultured Williamsia sp. TaxID=259311 RepID=UPI0026150A99|nr:hypothetical protein [uncultured Williamsia sp.]
MFEDEFFSKADLYSLGRDTDSGNLYLSIPVGSNMMDYEEYYRIGDDQYARFLQEPRAARDFADACRRREHDDLLILQPGWNRGTPFIPQ